MPRRRNARLAPNKGPVSSEELVGVAAKYMSGWIITLGESGAANVTENEDGTQTVTPGNVQAAIAGLKILQDHLSQKGTSRAESVLEKVAKMRRKSIEAINANGH
jgi:hypothetical protein